MLPPSIDEVYEEGIPVCATLEMSDRYRFHYPQQPCLKRSDAKTPHSGGQSKRSSRNLFHSNAPGLPLLTDANLAPAERGPSIPSILSKLVLTSCSSKIALFLSWQITPGAVLFDLIRSEDAFCF